MTNPFLNMASNIKLIALDFDGVLTDGSLYIDSKGNQLKKFDVKDGMGIKLLQNYGLHIALISGSKNNIISKRARSLNIKLVYKGIANKLITLKRIQKKLGIEPSQTIFLGDDINDLLVLTAVKMFVCPSDAHLACFEKAQWIGNSKGGEGFVREFTDLFLSALNKDIYLPFVTTNDD